MLRDVDAPKTSDPESPVFHRLLGLLTPHRPLVGFGLLALLLSVPLDLVPGAAALYLVDDVVIPFTTGSGEPGEKHSWIHFVASLGGRLTTWPALLASVAVWYFVLATIGTALRALSKNLLERATQRMIFQLRNDLYAKLQRESVGYLNKQRTGDLMSRTIGDVDQVQQFVVNGIDQVLAEALIWIAVVITVFLIDWRVASFTLAPILLIYVLLKLFNRKARPIYKAARESAASVSTRLQENLGGLTVIKIFGREPAEARRFETDTQSNYDDNIRAVNMRTTYFPITEVLAGVSGVAMYVSGAAFVLLGSFTLGGMLAFRSYFWRLFGPIFTLARVNDLIQRSTAAARRVFELLDATEDVTDPAEPVPLPETTRGHLRLDGVKFHYPNKPDAVLDGVDIDIPAGKTVALCGPSGAGKSTVLNLLLRFYDPDVGRVTLDDVDLRDVDRVSFRQRMALVQQETFLFAE
ncbi:MAG: ABC transporter ATP-binding protein, partial [Planctomycetota bacterium]